MRSAVTVRIVLSQARAEGLPFEEAWFRALRQIVPPPGSPPELVALHREDRALWRETKAHWRAAYEGEADADDQGLKEGLIHARRRLRDLLLADGEDRRELEDAARRLVRARRAREEAGVAASPR